MLTNFVRFFKEATPLYCAALCALWLVAVSIRVYRKQHVFFAEWVAFAFSILVILAYLRTEGWYRYFFEAMILALIFVPASLRTIAGELEHHVSKIKLLWFVPLPLVLLGAVQLYQLNYSSWVADHYASTQTSILNSYFAAHPDTATTNSVLVYNAPEVVPFLPGSNYYQYFDINPTGNLAYGAQTLQLLAQNVPTEVITTPSMYQQHMSLFGGYSESGTVGGYLILRRAKS